MTCNYYLHTNICECCGRPENILHLGLSASGWKFLFQAIEAEGKTPEIKSINDWRKLTDQPNSKIYDEYDKEVPKDAFWDFVEAKQSDRSHVQWHGVEGEYLDPDGYDFSTRDFS